MKKNSFVEGAVIATTAIVITKIIGMVYVIPFYKIIGSRGGALYSYAYNIYMIFLGISSAGVPTAISKIISEYDTLGYKEAKYRTYKQGIKIISYMSVIAFFIMFIFADVMAILILGDLKGGNTIEDVAFVIRCISVAILIIPYLSVTKGYMQGHRIMTPSSFSEVLEQIIRVFVVLAGSFLVYKVFNGTLTLAVGVAVTGAFFGGVAAYLYLRRVMKKHHAELDIKKFVKRDEISNKEIVKKIISYAVPFIIINIATFIYNFVDMVLIIRGLNYLGFNASDTEFIQSAITTWSSKICMIITSFALGMSISLIPNIVRSFVKKDFKGVEEKINRAYKIILAISIPCAIGLIVLSVPVWNLFYGPSKYGAIILQILVVSTTFNNLYTVTFNTMQALNKFKTVYVSIITGLVVNIILDIPFMILLNKIGLPSYWGTSFATITGYLTSIFIATHDLRKNYKMKFKDTYVSLLKLMVPSVCMLAVLLIFNSVITFDFNSRLMCIVAIAANIVLGAPIYLGIAHKMGLFTQIFGKEELNRIVKKLTFGKVSLND